MEPVFCRLFMVACFRLSYLIGMVSRSKVHSSAMNVERVTKIFTAHCRAFDVPSRKAPSPWRRPTHNMFWLRFDPQGEIKSSFLLILTSQITAVRNEFVDIPVGQYSIIMIFTIFLHVKIDSAVHFVSEIICQNLFHHLNLLSNMTSRRRLDIRRQRIEYSHDIMKSNGISLHDFHRFDLLQSGLL